ncbi:hypothetical protein HGT70_14280 [Rosenbergiella collisarenosi]|uniref:hypothetical protein n=1 Tax=Rosenbergiella collisarenosi TaxID=1544695 RepID=UPI001BD9DE7B|nr:hypothetical protein [Rosenbergiella collisarenosi]MBT0722442.1 hypothetical protein [Rosenbergiella collisarenosi]
MMDENALFTLLGKIHVLRMAAGLGSSPLQQKWVYFSASTQKVTFIYTPSGVMAGYFIWASVNRDTWRQLKSTGVWPVYRHEWDEGTLSLILDVLILPEWRGSLIPQLLKLRRDHQVMIWQRDEQPLRRHTSVSLVPAGASDVT